MDTDTPQVLGETIVSNTKGSLLMCCEAHATTLTCGLQEVGEVLDVGVFAAVLGITPFTSIREAQEHWAML